MNSFSLICFDLLHNRKQNGHILNKTSPSPTLAALLTVDLGWCYFHAGKTPPSVSTSHKEAEALAHGNEMTRPMHANRRRRAWRVMQPKRALWIRQRLPMSAERTDSTAARESSAPKAERHEDTRGRNITQKQKKMTAKPTTTARMTLMMEAISLSRIAHLKFLKMHILLVHSFP